MIKLIFKLIIFVKETMMKEFIETKLLLPKRYRHMILFYFFMNFGKLEIVLFFFHIHIRGTNKYCYRGGEKRNRNRICRVINYDPRE